jgi:prophage regulatory protein
MGNQSNQSTIIIRKRDLCKLLGISPPTLDRQRLRGEFPAPIKLGEQAIGWTMASVQAWIDSRPVAHHYGECIYIEDDGGDMPPDMQKYGREAFAEFVESLLHNMARFPALAADLTTEEIAMWCEFPERIRAHRHSYIYARPTDRIADLLKDPTWPTSKSRIEG